MPEIPLGACTVWGVLEFVAGVKFSLIGAEELQKQSGPWSPVLLWDFMKSNSQKDPLHFFLIINQNGSGFITEDLIFHPNLMVSVSKSKPTAI